MWNKLKAFLTWDAFSQGCDLYYKMLVAAGIVPGGQAIEDTIPTVGPSFTPDTVAIDIYSAKAVPHPGYGLIVIPSIDNVFHLN